MAEYLGHFIDSLDGRDLGWVISDAKKFWKLNDGKVIQKAAEGRKWRWSEKPPVATTHRSVSRSPEISVPAASPLHIPAASRLGSSIRGAGGAHWGLVVAEESHGYRLDSGHLAKKASENVHWKWEDDAASLCELPPPLEDVESQGPVELPPPQVDALLQFCLIEVLLAFDETRLPLPMTAIYSEMRRAAREMTLAARLRMESSVLRVVGKSCFSAQQEFLSSLAEGRIELEKINWTPDVKFSSFRSLDRMARHFHNADLIEVTKQRWHKRIHHSPNTRTCTELLLTGVNRAHPLYQAASVQCSEQ